MTQAENSIKEACAVRSPLSHHFWCKGTLRLDGLYGRYDFPIELFIGSPLVRANRQDLNSLAISQNLPMIRIVLASENQENAVTNNLRLDKD